MVLDLDLLAWGGVAFLAAWAAAVVCGTIRAWRDARAFDRRVRALARTPTPGEHAAWKARAWAERGDGPAGG